MTPLTNILTVPQALSNFPLFQENQTVVTNAMGFLSWEKIKILFSQCNPKRRQVLILSICHH